MILKQSIFKNGFLCLENVVTRSIQRITKMIFKGYHTRQLCDIVFKFLKLSFTNNTLFTNIFFSKMLLSISIAVTILHCDVKLV